MPSPLAYLGPALAQIGGQVSSYGSQQDELQRRFQLMLQQRAQQAFENNLKQDENARAQVEADRATKTDQDQTDFQKEITAGKTIPAIAPQVLAGPPSALQPPGTSTPEIPATSVPFTRDELVQKALEKGTLSPDKYLEYTKAKEITPTADIQDYQAARSQGFPGSFVDFLKTKSAATHIDVGGAAETRAKQTEVNSLRSGNASQTKDYDQVKRAALAFNADYANYKKQLASGNTQAIKNAQQGMVDKYITSSTGKSTGDAQFQNFRTSQGLENKFDNLSQQFLTGSMGPEAVFDNMHDLTMSTAEALRQKTQQANSATADMAAASLPRLGYINPEETFAHPAKMLTQDSIAFNSGNGNKQTGAQGLHAPGSTVIVGNKSYTVGADGNTLIPQ